MKSILTKIIPAFLVGILGLGFLAQPVSAVQDIDICKELTSGSAAWKANGCGDDASGQQFSNVILTIINVVIGAAGIVALIFIVIGGYNYMISAGDPGKVKKAKDTIMYAVIGLIVCILAAAIVNFVIKAVTKQPASSFSSQKDCEGAGYTWSDKGGCK